MVITQYWRWPLMGSSSSCSTRWHVVRRVEEYKMMSKSKWSLGIYFYFSELLHRPNVKTVCFHQTPTLTYHGRFVSIGAQAYPACWAYHACYTCPCLLLLHAHLLLLRMPTCCCYACYYTYACLPAYCYYPCCYAYGDHLRLRLLSRFPRLLMKTLATWSTRYK
jgi:hypothetical protein